MKKVTNFLILLLAFLTIGKAAAEQNEPQRIDSTARDIVEIRDTFLARQFTDAEFYALLSDKELKANDLESQGRLGQACFLRATIEYFRGLLPGEYGNKEEGSPHFDKATEWLEKIPHWENISEVHRFMAEIRGQQMLIGGIGALIANYFPLEGHLKKALELDPDNRKAEILYHFRLVYGPPLFVRNYNKAEKLYLRYAREALATGGDPWEAYVSYQTLGMMEEKRNNPEKARDYYLKALTIYEQNYFVCLRLLELGFDPEKWGFSPPDFLQSEL